MTVSKFDGYIFDMDGTLWDAVGSYCAIWNATIAQTGLRSPQVSYDRLVPLMGRPIGDIMRVLVGDVPAREEFLERLFANESSMMPVLGGRLYPGVRETLEELSRNSRLFMVSNCGPDGIRNFLKFTGLGEIMTDHLSFGENGCEKDVNIRTIVERYNLRKPLYVGDVQRDCDESHRAGVPFAWASYGFGTDVVGAEFVLRAPEDLLNLYSLLT